MSMAYLPSLAPGLAALSLALAAVSAVAQSTGEQRARIEREQAAAEARYAEREAVCLQQFIVTACVNEARAERRTVLERLRNERLMLDEQQRKQRAADRLAGVEKRRQERAQAEREAAGRVADRASAAGAGASAAELAPAPALPRIAPPAGASANAPRPAPDRRDERARAAERAAQQAQRASAAQEHRRRVEERNRRDPPPPSLPVPGQLPASAP